MNNSRRDKIKLIINELEIIKDKLNSVLSDEEMACDNTPENLQSSSRYEESEEAIDNMNEAIEYLDSAISNLEEI